MYVSRTKILLAEATAGKRKDALRRQYNEWKRSLHQSFYVQALLQAYQVTNRRSLRTKTLLHLIHNHQPWKNI